MNDTSVCPWIRLFFIIFFIFNLVFSFEIFISINIISYCLIYWKVLSLEWNRICLLQLRMQRIWRLVINVFWFLDRDWALDLTRIYLSISAFPRTLKYLIILTPFLSTILNHKRLIAFTPFNIKLEAIFPIVVYFSKFILWTILWPFLIFLVIVNISHWTFSIQSIRFLWWDTILV